MHPPGRAANSLCITDIQCITNIREFEIISPNCAMAAIVSTTGNTGPGNDVRAASPNV